MSADGEEGPPGNAKGQADDLTHCEDTRNTTSEGIGDDPGSVKPVAAIRSRKPEPPYCWQNKEARRRIREAFDESSNICSALSVYDALTEIASDESSERFKTCRAHIAKISGTSVPTVKRVLKKLAKIRLISIEYRENTTSFYVLFSVNYREPQGHGDPPAGHSTFRAPRPVVERTEKEHKKEREKVVTFSSLEEAGAHYTPLFPDIPVKNSLSKMKASKKKEGLNYKDFLNTAYLDKWFAREECRKPPTSKEPEIKESHSGEWSGDYLEERKGYKMPEELSDAGFVPGAENTKAEWAKVKAGWKNGTTPENSIPTPSKEIPQPPEPQEPPKEYGFGMGDRLWIPSQEWTSLAIANPQLKDHYAKARFSVVSISGIVTRVEP